MATCPSLIPSSPRENCCWPEEGAAGGGFCPIVGEFQTPCAFLINSTLGRSRVSESSSTDLLSRGSNLTETLNSWVWTNGSLLLNFGAADTERLATRKRGGNNPKSILPIATLRSNCCSSFAWIVPR